MEQPQSKPVTLIELFYDLVFVYMISRATSLIHHLHHGVINPNTFMIFALVIIVFINSWMIQMVFTNRYGESSWTNITFTFIDMAIVLYMSNAFPATFNQDLRTFFIAAGLLSLTLCLQYLIVYFHSKSFDRQISRSFALILGFRTITFFIGGFIPGTVGTTIAIVGVILSWIAPAFTGKYTRHRPIIFSHLLERLTALIIMMFGETIVGIANYFTAQNFSLLSLMIFISVVGLFFTYIVEFDHLIDEKQTNQTGNLLIYLHYFILFGISLFTVSLSFISEPDANPLFAASRLFGSIALFYIGLWLANSYNRVPVSNKVIVAFAATTIVGYLVNLCWLTFPGFVTTSTVVIICNAAILTHYNVTHQ